MKKTVELRQDREPISAPASVKPKSVKLRSAQSRHSRGIIRIGFASGINFR